MFFYCHVDADLVCQLTWPLLFNLCSMLMVFNMCMKNNLKIYLRFLAGTPGFDTLYKMYSDKLEIQSG